ncbi:MAG: hypothetical protein U5R06_00520 [candidate division KSB1 bacterium]|nr:hypothetical protein [candidate division KSB1 bacterium]
MGKIRQQAEKGKGKVISRELINHRGLHRRIVMAQFCESTMECFGSPGTLIPEGCGEKTSVARVPVKDFCSSVLNHGFHALSTGMEQEKRGGWGVFYY